MLWKKAAVVNLLTRSATPPGRMVLTTTPVLRPPMMPNPRPLPSFMRFITSTWDHSVFNCEQIARENHLKKKFSFAVFIKKNNNFYIPFIIRVCYHLYNTSQRNYERKLFILFFLFLFFFLISIAVDHKYLKNTVILLVDSIWTSRGFKLWQKLCY